MGSLLSGVQGGEMKKIKTYELYNFNDFLKIPYDKLPEALAQFAEAILKTKKTHDLFKKYGTSGKITIPLIFNDDDINKSTLKIIGIS